MTPTPLVAEGQIVAAVDVGSARVACLIGRVGPGGAVEVLGTAQQASAGVSGGIPVDWPAAGAAVRRAVHAAETQAAAAAGGYPLRDVVLAVPALRVRLDCATGEVATTGRGRVEPDDPLRALAAAQAAGLAALPAGEAELLHAIPRAYTLDGRGGITAPGGLDGAALSVDAGLVTAEAGPLKTLARLASAAHLSVVGLCAGPYAAGLACLVEDEMDLGATVVDMGADTTSWACFAGGALAGLGAVPIGGAHVTSDIARGLTTPRAEAERIKVLHGSAMAGAFDAAEMLEVPTLGEGQAGEPRHVARSVLVGIIQPRLEETLEAVRAALTDARLEAGRVVLTGGAAQLPGMRDLAQHVLERPVRLGRPLRPDTLPDEASGPGFAVAAGLLTYVATRGHEAPAQIMDSVQPAGAWARVWAWLKENW
jgi:cell division protein FtsA